MSSGTGGVQRPSEVPSASEQVSKASRLSPTGLGAWLGFRIRCLFSDDKTIASELLLRLKNNSIDASALRWFSVNQLKELHQTAKDDVDLITRRIPENKLRKAYIDLLEKSIKPTVDTAHQITRSSVKKGHLAAILRIFTTGTSATGPTIPGTVAPTTAPPLTSHTADVATVRTATTRVLTDTATIGAVVTASTPPVSPADQRQPPPPAPPSPPPAPPVGRSADSARASVATTATAPTDIAGLGTVAAAPASPLAPAVVTPPPPVPAPLPSPAAHVADVASASVATTATVRTDMARLETGVATPASPLVPTPPPPAPLPAPPSPPPPAPLPPPAPQTPPASISSALPQDAAAGRTPFVPPPPLDLSGIEQGPDITILPPTPTAPREPTVVTMSGPRPSEVTAKPAAVRQSFELRAAQAAASAVAAPRGVNAAPEVIPVADRIRSLERWIEESRRLQEAVVPFPEQNRDALQKLTRFSTSCIELLKKYRTSTTDEAALDQPDKAFNDLSARLAPLQVECRQKIEAVRNILLNQATNSITNPDDRFAFVERLTQPIPADSEQLPMFSQQLQEVQGDLKSALRLQNRATINNLIAVSRQLKEAIAPFVVAPRLERFQARLQELLERNENLATPLSESELRDIQSSFLREATSCCNQLVAERDTLRAQVGQLQNNVKKEQLARELETAPTPTNVDQAIEFAKTLKQVKESYAAALELEATALSQLSTLRECAQTLERLRNGLERDERIPQIYQRHYIEQLQAKYLTLVPQLLQGEPISLTDLKPFSRDRTGVAGVAKRKIAAIAEAPYMREMEALRLLIAERNDLSLSRAYATLATQFGDCYSEADDSDAYRAFVAAYNSLSAGRAHEPEVEAPVTADTAQQAGSSTDEGGTPEEIVQPVAPSEDEVGATAAMLVREHMPSVNPEGTAAVSPSEFLATLPTKLARLTAAQQEALTPLLEELIELSDASEESATVDNRIRELMTELQEKLDNFSTESPS